MDDGQDEDKDMQMMQRFSW